MEKLIELLNEYGNEICNHWGDYQADMDFTDRDTYWYLSKKFGFIKWLVENDKIDFENQAMQYAKSDLSKFFTEWEDKNGMSDDYAMLLMLLAIQDEPIKFILEILK